MVGTPYSSPGPGVQKPHFFSRLPLVPMTCRSLRTGVLCCGGKKGSVEEKNRSFVGGGSDALSCRAGCWEGSLRSLKGLLKEG